MESCTAIEYTFTVTQCFLYYRICKNRKHLSDLQHQSKGRAGWEKVKKLVFDGSVRSLAEDSIPSRSRAFSLLSGEEIHEVWKPKFSFLEIVATSMKKHKEDKSATEQFPYHEIEEEEEKENFISHKSQQALYFKRRQKTFMKRVNFAWKVLQENQPMEATAPAEVQIEEPTKLSGLGLWKATVNKVMRSTAAKKQPDFSYVVTKLLAQQNKE